VRAPQVGEAAALHDAKQRLPLRARDRERAPRPSRGSLHGLLDVDPRRVTRRAHVELHLNVGAYQALQAHGVFWRQYVARTVQVRFEREPLLRGFHERGPGSPSGERVGLKAARVGQHGVRPASETVQAAELRDRLGARSQHQVVGVAEHHTRSGGRDVVGSERLDTSLCADGHEGGRIHGPVRRLEHGASSLAVAGDDAEGEPRGARGQASLQSSIASP